MFLVVYFFVSTWVLRLMTSNHQFLQELINIWINAMSIFDNWHKCFCVCLVLSVLWLCAWSTFDTLIIDWPAVSLYRVTPMFLLLLHPRTTWDYPPCQHSDRAPPSLPPHTPPPHPRSTVGAAEAGVRGRRPGTPSTKLWHL